MWDFPMHYIWLAVLVLGIIVEAGTLSLTSIWFAIAGMLCYLLALLGVPFVFQVLSFVVISALLLVFTKPIAQKYLRIGGTKTNADRVVGQVGVVVVAIEPFNNVGQVKVNGQIWSAKTQNQENIDLGKRVRIISIEGVKLIVEEEM